MTRKPPANDLLEYHDDGVCQDPELNAQYRVNWTGTYGIELYLEE